MHTSTRDTLERSELGPAPMIQLGHLDTVGHRGHLMARARSSARTGSLVAGVVAATALEATARAQYSLTILIVVHVVTHRVEVLFGQCGPCGTFVQSFHVPGSWMYGDAACKLSTACGMNPADRIGGLRRK